MTRTCTAAGQGTEPALDGAMLRSVALAVVALSSLVACAGDPEARAGRPGGGGKADDLAELPEGPLPRRIILLIGDGMGVAQLSAGAYAADEPLHIASMPRLGLIATHEHEFVTTDSAAAATALASGSKTHFGGISVVPGTDGHDDDDPALQLGTVLEDAERVGWKTGLVTTTSVVDATPAAFAAHRNDRGAKDGIADDLLASGVDVLIGGGTRWFSDRPDGDDLLADFSDRDYSVARTALGLRRVAGRAERVVALLAERDLPAVMSGDRPMSLAEMTEHAITVLDRENDDGFFLMVEGGWIDRESHGLDGPSTVAEVLDFDAAVGVALDYARGRDDTLVVVTADHETGGLAVLDPDDASAAIEELGGAAATAERAAFPQGFSPPPVSFVELGASPLAPDAADPRAALTYGHLSLASRPLWNGPTFVYMATHSASMVPIAAEGPAAAAVTALRDNAAVGALLRRIVSEDGHGSPAPEIELEAPSSLVVIVADGAGVSAWSAALYARGAPVTSSMPVAGLVATRALDRLVPAAAGAAVALATGRGARADGSDLDAAAALLVRAEAAGRATGLVTSGELGDPATAAFAGATAAAGLPGAGLEVVFGGGGDAFSDAELDAWAAGGAAVEIGWDDSAAAPPVVRLVAGGPLAPAADRLRGEGGPTLESMTASALETLASSGDDFVLVVTAPGPGASAAAGSVGSDLVDEIADVDGAVRAALAHAATQPGTAVVVVGLRDTTLSVLDDHYGFHRDHCGVALRCGGPEMLTELPVAIADVPHGDGLSAVALQGDFSPVGLVLQHGWLGQVTRAETGAPIAASAHLVPLFAAGPGAAALEGFSSLAEVGAVLGDWAAAP